MASEIIGRDSCGYPVYAPQQVVPLTVGPSTTTTDNSSISTWTVTYPDVWAMERRIAELEQDMKQAYLEIGTISKVLGQALDSYIKRTNRRKKSTRKSR